MEHEINEIEIEIEASNTKHKPYNCNNLNMDLITYDTNDNPISKKEYSKLIDIDNITQKHKSTVKTNHKTVIDNLHTFIHKPIPTDTIIVDNIHHKNERITIDTTKTIIEDFKPYTETYPEYNGITTTIYKEGETTISNCIKSNGNRVIPLPNNPSGYNLLLSLPRDTKLITFGNTNQSLTDNINQTNRLTQTIGYWFKRECVTYTDITTKDHMLKNRWLLLTYNGKHYIDNIYISRLLKLYMGYINYKQNTTNRVHLKDLCTQIKTIDKTQILNYLKTIINGISENHKFFSNTHGNMKYCLDHFKLAYNEIKLYGIDKDYKITHLTSRKQLNDKHNLKTNKGLKEEWKNLIDYVDYNSDIPQELLNKL